MVKTTGEDLEWIDEFQPRFRDDPIPLVAVGKKGGLASGERQLLDQSGDSLAQAFYWALGEQDFNYEQRTETVREIYRYGASLGLRQALLHNIYEQALH